MACREGERPRKPYSPERLFDKSRQPIVLVVVLILDSPALFDYDYENDDEDEQECACGIYGQALRRLGSRGRSPSRVAG